MNLPLSRKLLRIALFLWPGTGVSTYALEHSVTKFRLDFSGSALDTAKLDVGWSDSLLINAQTHKYRNVRTDKLNKGSVASNNGAAAAGAVVTSTGQYKFKVAYLSYQFAHTSTNAASSLLANIVTRNIDLSPDTLWVDTASTVIALNEVMGYQSPIYLNYSGEGNKYSAYWGSNVLGGPIRRSSHKEASSGIAFGNWGVNIPLAPATPVASGGLGKVSAALQPNTGGNQYALAYETPGAYPAGKFEVRWENIDAITTEVSPTVVTAVIPEDFAVAMDSLGNTAVLWRQEIVKTSPVSSSNLWLTAYDPSHTVIYGPTMIQTNIFSRDTLALEHLYRPFAITSQRKNNFLFTYGRTTGANTLLYFRELSLSGTPTVSAESAPLTPPGDAAPFHYMFPDLASTADRVVVSWFKRGNTNYSQRLKGSILSKINGSYTMAGRVDLDFASENVAFGAPTNGLWYQYHYFKSASVAMDDRGNIVAAYDSGGSSKVAMVSNTSIYYDSAEFVSKIFRVENAAIPGTVFDPSSDSVDFLSINGVGSDSANTGLQLAVASDSATLGAGPVYLPLLTHKVATTGFYRYRVLIKTNTSVDTLITNRTTPKLLSMSIKMNVKPRNLLLDSIKVGSAPMVHFDSNALYVLRPRKDSLRLVCSAFDLDDSTLDFRVSIGKTILKTAAAIRKSPGKFSVAIALKPLDTIPDPLPLTIVAVDDKGWNSAPFTFLLKHKNTPPIQSLQVFRNRGRDSLGFYVPRGGGMDSLIPLPLELILVQVKDTLTIKGTYTDSNDDSLTSLWWKNSDSLNNHAKKISKSDVQSIKFPVDTVAPLIDTLTFSIRDKDTIVNFKFRVRPNRVPSIDSVRHYSFKMGDSTYFIRDSLKVGRFDRITNFGSDSTLVVPAGLLTTLDAGTSDQDVSLGDSLKLFWATWAPMAGCAPSGNLACYTQTDSMLGKTFTHTFAPSVPDQFLTLRAVDISGAFLQRKIKLEFSIADTAGMADAAKALNGKELRFVLGAKIRDTTVKLEITNTGNIPLQILAVSTKNNDRKWLNFKLEWLSGSVGNELGFNGRTSDNLITNGNQVFVDADGKLGLKFTFFSDSLRGDSILSDTLVVRTADFANPVFKIPFQIKYDDLPLLRIGIPGAAAAGSGNGFNAAGLPALVPARSNLVFSFNERVKIREPDSVFQIYSLLDSLKSPFGYHRIAGAFSYRLKSKGLGKIAAAADSVADSLVFTPRYDRKSDSMQVQPAPGYFIYRDVLHIRVSNQITDLAGNSLDLKLDRSLEKFSAVFEAKVDTGFFRVIESEPAPGVTGWKQDQPMRIRFNRKLAQRPPWGVDSLTSLDLKTMQGDSNNAIRITSAFMGKKRYDFLFLALENGDSTLVFKTRPHFPAKDTVTIALSGALMDTSGLSLDGNGNYFPDWLYSRVDSADAFSFSFMTGYQDFYIYPNPFRFSDARHREKGSITFKNVNTLTGFVPGQPVTLRIHTMTGELVYASRDGSAVARAGANSEVFSSLGWDLQNRAGTTVGTGVYIYTLMTGNSKVLRKGKVAVVR